MMKGDFDGMTAVDLLIFDFDGTLVDTGEDLVETVNYTLRTLGFPGKTFAEIVGYIGEGVSRLLERSLGVENLERHEEAKGIFMKYYSEHLLDNTRLYPGVMEILRHFEAKRKWIVTNKTYAFTAIIAERLKVIHFFDGIIGRDCYSFAKPDARLVEGILERYGIQKDRTLVVGDGLHDIEMAKNTGVWSCAFLNGLGAREALLRLRPDFFIESIVELKTLFC
jgi:phosphoglycolate phosphatase